MIFIIKRITAVILAFTVLLHLFVAADAAFDPYDYVHGDADRDKELSIVDATAIQRYIASIPFLGIDTIAADYNSDGSVEIVDVTFIQRKLAGVIVPPFCKNTQINLYISAYCDKVDYEGADYSVTELDRYVPPSDIDSYSPEGLALDLPADGILYIIDGDHKYSYQANYGTNYIYNLIPGSESTYLLTGEDGKHLAAGLVYTEAGVRIIRTQATPNVRDIGGWSCDGGVIKYGMIFRGGEIDTKDTGLFRDILGVKAELNLRWDDEVDRDYSVLGDDIDYRHVSGPWYTLDQKSVNWDDDALVRIVNYVMDSVIDNKPVYIHCSAGADRSSTVLFVIEALLGMSQSDLDKEYELTSFYTGVETESQMRARNEGGYPRLVKELNRYPGDTPKEKALTWASEQGISFDKINEFQAIMIN